MYLIFDTETTGLPKNWKAPISDTENWPRCVQLAWQVHDEWGNLIESKSYIVKPDDYDIPFESEKIHGISTLLAEKEGINIDDILNEFNDSISKSKFIIGHNVNFDLIYGRQFQNLSEWEKELEFALSLESQHLSLYQLTIEKGTAFKNIYNAGKLKGLPSQELSRRFFITTNKLCKKKKFNSYEISNFAKNKFECVHNLNYWKCGNFIGIGPGAHGRFEHKKSRFSYKNIMNPENWLE